MEIMIDPVDLIQIKFSLYPLEQMKLISNSLYFVCIVLFEFPVSGLSLSLLQILLHTDFSRLFIACFSNLMPLFSSKKYLKFHFNFQVQKSFQQKMSNVKLVSSTEGIEVKCVFLFPSQRDLEVVVFQMIDLSCYRNSNFY